MTRLERDALDAQLTARENYWEELHYSLVGFCDLVGIPVGRDGSWEEFHAIYNAVLGALVVEAKKRGWRAEDSEDET